MSPPGPIGWSARQAAMSFVRAPRRACRFVHIARGWFRNHPNHAAAADSQKRGTGENHRAFGMLWLTPEPVGFNLSITSSLAGRRGMGGSQLTLRLNERSRWTQPRFVASLGSRLLLPRRFSI